MFERLLLCTKLTSRVSHKQNTSGLCSSLSQCKQNTRILQFNRRDTPLFCAVLTHSVFGKAASCCYRNCIFYIWRQVLSWRTPRRTCSRYNSNNRPLQSWINHFWYLALLTIHSFRIYLLSILSIRHCMVVHYSRDGRIFYMWPNIYSPKKVTHNILV